MVNWFLQFWQALDSGLIITDCNRKPPPGGLWTQSTKNQALYLHDLELGQMLPVALGAAVAGLRVILEGDLLLVAHLAEHLCLDNTAFEVGRADGDGIAVNGKKLVEGDDVALLQLELFYPKLHAGFDAI